MMMTVMSCRRTCRTSHLMCSSQALACVRSLHRSWSGGCLGRGCCGHDLYPITHARAQLFVPTCMSSSLCLYVLSRMRGSLPLGETRCRPSRRCVPGVRDLASWRYTRSPILPSRCLVFQCFQTFFCLIMLGLAVRGHRLAVVRPPSLFVSVPGLGDCPLPVGCSLRYVYNLRHDPIMTHSRLHLTTS